MTRHPGIGILSSACFTIGVVAVVIPYWGYYKNYVMQEHGHFGSWKVCKFIDNKRSVCGRNVTTFQPFFSIIFAGICAIGGAVFMGVYAVVNFLLATPPLKRFQLNLLIVGIVCSFSSALMIWVAVILVGIRPRSQDKGFVVELGHSFYLEIVVGIFAIFLFVNATQDYISTKRREQRLRRIANGEIKIEDDEAFGNNNKRYICGDKNCKKLDHSKCKNAMPYQDGDGYSFEGDDEHQLFYPGRERERDTLLRNEDGCSCSRKNINGSCHSLKDGIPFTEQCLTPPRPRKKRSSLGSISDFAKRLSTEGKFSDGLFRSRSQEKCHNLGMGIPYTDLCLTPQAHRKRHGSSGNLKDWDRIERESSDRIKYSNSCDNLSRGASREKVCHDFGAGVACTELCLVPQDSIMLN